VLHDALQAAETPCFGGSWFLLFLLFVSLCDVLSATWFHVNS
jgi:hypothetical protein